MDSNPFFQKRNLGIDIYTPFSQKIRSMLYLIPTKPQVSYKTMDQLNDVLQDFENNFIDINTKDIIIDDILTTSQIIACSKLQIICKKIIGSLQELQNNLSPNENYKGITFQTFQKDLRFLIKYCVLLFITIHYPIDLNDKPNF